MIQFFDFFTLVTSIVVTVLASLCMYYFTMYVKCESEIDYTPGKIIVQYNDESFTISDTELAWAFKEYVGEYAFGTLEHRTFRDNHTEDVFQLVYKEGVFYITGIVFL